MPQGEQGGPGRLTALQLVLAAIDRWGTGARCPRGEAWAVGTFFTEETNQVATIHHVCPPVA